MMSPMRATPWRLRWFGEGAAQGDCGVLDGVVGRLDVPLPPPLKNTVARELVDEVIEHADVCRLRRAIEVPGDFDRGFASRGDSWFAPTSVNFLPAGSGGRGSLTSIGGGRTAAKAGLVWRALRWPSPARSPPAPSGGRGTPRISAGGRRPAPALRPRWPPPGTISGPISRTASGLPTRRG
jgi:hypothetical protein